MSIDLAKTRLVDHATAYKRSLRNVTPLNPPVSAASGALPNDAARSSKAQRTRQRNHGDSRHTPAGMQTLSKKP